LIPVIVEDVPAFFLFYSAFCLYIYTVVSLALQSAFHADSDIFYHIHFVWLYQVHLCKWRGGLSWSWLYGS